MRDANKHNTAHTRMYVVDVLISPMRFMRCRSGAGDTPKHEVPGERQRVAVDQPRGQQQDAQSVQDVD